MGNRLFGLNAMTIFFSLGYFVGYVKREYRAGRELALTVQPHYRTVEEDVKIKRVVDLLRADPNASIIAAVKLHREIFNSSLKDAVDQVRELKAKL